MTILLALAIALSTHSAESPDLCTGFENRIVEDMRILEADLAQSAAATAVEKLRAMVEQGQVAGEFRFGALNQLKIVHGHVLLKQALMDRNEFGPDSVEFQESKASLCDWLGTKGFWYD